MDMEPNEILARCNAIGALVYAETRCLKDVYGSDIPRSDVVRYVTRHSEFEIEDGMVRARRGDWLPWQNHGRIWCFCDEDPHDVENEMLKESLWRLRSGR